MKKSEQVFKLGFFLSQSHIGLPQDFQAKLGQFQQDQDGWAIC